jgi:tRNA dimethylallyltransferase
MNEFSISTGKMPLIALVGPTASGKTKLAVSLAAKLDAELISADSRQVYKGMDIGTGKDLKEYKLDNKLIPYHLIDIVEAGSKYNVYEYQRDFLTTWSSLQARNKPAVLCGGTGMYVESVLRGYRLVPVPVNAELRTELGEKSLAELTQILASYKALHNSTDVDTQKRALRAIEIEEYYRIHPEVDAEFPKINFILFCLDLDRDLRRKRISERLKSRLNEGMIEEVEGLLASGIPADDLIYYGLEYKFVTLYLLGEITFQELFSKLEVAIHQFAKRQMTWFRGMETRGLKVHWLNAMASTEDNVHEMLRTLNPND